MNFAISTTLVSANLRKIQGCLSNLKTLDSAARRRQRPERDEDILLNGIISPFAIDADLKIPDMQAYRRSGSKTAVMTNAMNYHVRTRLAHMHEVAALSSFTASILGLNAELARAIGLVHDIGHTPFGHDGEAFLKEITGGRFCHEGMGIVIAQHIERGGKGANLTHQVLRGIARTSYPDPKCGGPLHQEGQCVAYCDRIRYVTSDYSDIQRFGYPVSDRLRKLMHSLGRNRRAQVNTLVLAFCEESAAEGKVSFSKSEIAHVFAEVKDLMYEVYHVLNVSDTHKKLREIYEFLQKYEGALDLDPRLILALLTDQDALFMISKQPRDFTVFRQTTAYEIVMNLRGQKIDWCDPDLNW